MIVKEEFTKERNEMVSKEYLRPFIKGYTRTTLLNDEHNHSIAVSQFRESFNREGYCVTPFLYPDGCGVSEPISFVMKTTSEGSKVVSRIYWKRHPEIYEFLFKD